MGKSKVDKYINSVAYFSILWGIKEFILEPIISKLKDDNKKKLTKK